MASILQRGRRGRGRDRNDDPYGGPYDDVYDDLYDDADDLGAYDDHDDYDDLGGSRPPGGGGRSRLPYVLGAGALAFVLLAVLALRWWPVDGRTILVVPDLTDSYVPPPAGQGLEAIAEDCFATGCTLQAIGLDDLSSSPVLLFDEQLSTPTGLEDAARDAYVDEQVAATVEQLDGVLVPRADESCSDVVGSFTAAAEQLDGASGSRELVVMSDMVTSCDPWLVTDLEPGMSAVQPLVAEMDSAGAVPDLSGVQVSVVTGNQAEELRRLSVVVGVHLDPQVLRSFWTAFLEAAGADISAPGWWSSGYSA
jgi:hypothetical protein